MTARPAAYVRVSTSTQTYDQQIGPVVNYCKMRGWPAPAIFQEVKSAGQYREVFQGLIKRAKEGEFTHIVVFRIDRAYRSSREFILDFDALQARGITLVSISEGIDPSTPMGKAAMTILVALAELEKANLSRATKERLGALKNMGKRLGRPPGSKDKKKRKNTGYLLREQRKRGVRA